MGLSTSGITHQTAACAKCMGVPHHSFPVRELTRCNEGDSGQASKLRGAEESLRSFKLEKLATRRLDVQTELLTYQLTVQGDAGGNDISGSYWATSLWHSVNGKWLLQWHTETKAQ